MKRLFRLTFLPLLFITAISCSEDDSLAIASPDTAPVLISPEDNASVILSEGLEANNAVTLVWNHSNYDVATVIDYDVQISVGDGPFQHVTTTTNRVYSMTVGELNTKVLGEGLTPFEAGIVKFKVIGTLGDNSDLPMESNIITLNVTPFEATIPEEPVTPMLYLVGAVQAYYNVAAWTPENGMPMRYIGDGTTKVFEAYVKVAPGDGFKFIGGLDWNTGNFGTIGGAQDGNIEDNGGSGDIKVAETDGPGLYYVQVDIDNLTYKAVKMNWGIIGAATPGGWDNETPMVYDFATNTFSLTTTTTAGEMKFRASNASQYIYGSSESWKFNVGVSDPMVTYNGGAGNFAVAAGSHAFTLSIDLMGNATVGGM